MVTLCLCSGSPANGVLSHKHTHTCSTHPHITPSPQYPHAQVLTIHPIPPLNFVPPFTHPLPLPSPFTHPLPLSHIPSPPPLPTPHTHTHTYNMYIHISTHKHTHTNPQLTELLQKVLINFMKEQFADRLVTIKPNFSVLNMSGKEGTAPFTDVHVAI